MPNYNVYWSKTYHVSGYVEIETDSFEEAEEFVRERMGDYEGSMQYDADRDFVEAYEPKKYPITSQQIPATPSWGDKTM